MGWSANTIGLMAKTMFFLIFSFKTNPMKIESWIAQMLFTCDIAT